MLGRTVKGQNQPSENMRDVVVIGGGLSGLAACYQLEKTNLRYTLIEVKRRVGGGIQTFASAASSWMPAPV